MRCLVLLLVLLVACSANESEKLAEQLVSETDFSYIPIEPQVEELTSSEQNITVEMVDLGENTTENTTEAIFEEQKTVVKEQEIIITQTPVTEVNETEETEQNVSAISNTSEKRPLLYYFFDLFNQNVKSYQFVFMGNQYFVKGTKYKKILSRPGVIQDAKWANGTKRSTLYYDTIYIDRVQKSATAYCEGYKSEVNRKCTELDLYELAYELSFDEHSILLPEDWLYSYLNKEPSVFEENNYELGSRATTLFVFSDGFITELNLDKKTGIVVRADQKKDTNLLARYDYEDLATNTVRDVDVIHRKKDEIPPSEAFYKIV